MSLVGSDALGYVRSLTNKKAAIRMGMIERQSIGEAAHSPER